MVTCMFGEGPPDLEVLTKNLDFKNKYNYKQQHSIKIVESNQEFRIANKRVGEVLGTTTNEYPRSPVPPLAPLPWSSGGK